MDNRIKELNKSGISCASIERILSLPQGSVKSWEKGKMKSEEEALLNMIYAFPWLLCVAENKYKGKIKLTISTELDAVDLGQIQFDK